MDADSVDCGFILASAYAATHDVWIRAGFEAVYREVVIAA